MFHDKDILKIDLMNDDDKKEYEIGNIYIIVVALKNIHNLLMISATRRSIFFVGLYIFLLTLKNGKIVE